MPNLPVQHLIFSRVERAYSPKNASGYQIVYQSPNLREETVQIEKRLQCFDQSKPDNERYQFFWTDEEQAVLTKTVALFQPDPDVIDRTQRTAFLAHALIFTKETFASIRNDPFAIFAAAEENRVFTEDTEQLVNYLQGETPASTFIVPLRKRSDIGYLLDGWPPDELFKLFSLGLQAITLRQQKQSILLIDEDQDELFLLLQLIFMLIPPDERALCTFDTYVDTCYPSTGELWLLGCTRGKSHIGLLPIRLHEQRLSPEGGGDLFLAPKVQRLLALPAFL